MEVTMDRTLDVAIDNELMILSMVRHGYHQGYQWNHVTQLCPPYRCARPSATTSPNTTWTARPATSPRTQLECHGDVTRHVRSDVRRFLWTIDYHSGNPVLFWSILAHYSSLNHWYLHCSIFDIPASHLVLGCDHVYIYIYICICMSYQQNCRKTPLRVVR